MRIQKHAPGAKCVYQSTPLEQNADTKARPWRKKEIQEDAAGGKRLDKKEATGEHGVYLITPLEHSVMTED